MDAAHHQPSHRPLPWLSRRRLLVLLAAVTIIAAAALPRWLAPVAGGQGGVESLASSEEPLRAYFNANQDKARLLILVSPT